MEYDEISNVKCAALSYAIKAACGTEQNDMGHITTNPTKLIEAAKIIEAYIKD